MEKADGAFLQFPTMMVGMCLGVLANLVGVKYFHLPKILLLVGYLPSAFIGALIALCLFHWWYKREAKEIALERAVARKRYQKYEYKRRNRE